MKRKIKNLREKITHEDTLYYRNIVSNYSKQQKEKAWEETDYLRDYSGSLEDRLYLHENIGVPYEITCTSKACRIYGGRTEVNIENIGRIDLITKFEGVDYIIESKVLSSWKHALGQVLAYYHTFNAGKHKYLPAIALLKQNYCDISLDTVKKVCNPLGVTVMTLSNKGELRIV